jgi:hypothetical protein
VVAGYRAWVQVLPFQCSISGLPRPELIAPTAQALPAEVAATPLNKAFPPGVGV